MKRWLRQAGSFWIIVAIFWMLMGEPGASMACLVLASLESAGIV